MEPYPRFDHPLSRGDLDVDKEPATFAWHNSRCLQALSMRGGRVLKPSSSRRISDGLNYYGPSKGSSDMRVWYCVALCSVALFCGAMPGTTVQAAPPVTLQSDGSIHIAGRTLRCGKVRNALDAQLPNLGISVPDRRLLVVNPLLLARQPETVRLFVFHHECGHHNVGASELNADCWAVRRGVQEGWLNNAGLVQVCNSFHGAPATATHPSGARRCSNLDRCFAAAQAEKAASEQTTARAEPATSPIPRLVIGPRLVRDGVLRYSE
jgi:hypothetical protein